MMIFQVGGGLHFDETPVIPLPALQDVSLYNDSLIFKSTFEYCRDLKIRKELLGSADGLSQSAAHGYFDTPWEQLTGKSSDFVPLCNDRIDSSLCSRCQFRLVQL